MAKAQATMESIPIDDLVLEPDLHDRADGIIEDQVLSMMEVVESNGLPRIKVMRVKALGDVVADGWNRVEAHRRAGLKTVPAEVTVASVFEAKMACARANRDQLGARRTNADKRKSVLIVFGALAESKQDMTDNAIAADVTVSPSLVRTIRAEVQDATAAKKPGIPLPDAPTRTGKDGREYAKKPAKKPEPKVEEPKKKLPKVKPPKEDDGWESVPLSEFLDDVEPFVLNALIRSGVTNAGELSRRAIAGEQFGLMKGHVRDLQDAVENLKNSHVAATPDEEKPQGAPTAFDHAGFNAAFGKMMRGVDEFHKTHPNVGPPNAHHNCMAHANNFLKEWNAWVKAVES